MMLRMSFDLPKEADEVEAAVAAALASGARTRDIAWGGPSIGCKAMTELILEYLG